MICKQFACSQHISLLKRITRRKENLLRRNRISYRKNRLQERLVEIVTDTSHLTGRRHIHAQHRVSLLKTCKRELRWLHTYVIQVERTLLRSCRMLAEHNLRSEFYEVNLQHLRHEWKTTWSTQVALYDLNLVLLSEELDIERTGNLKRTGNLAGNLLDPSYSLHIKFLRRELDSGITGVHASILDMLRNGISENLTLIRYSIELDFLTPVHEFTDDHRMLLRYIWRKRKEPSELFLIVANVHGSTWKHIRRTHEDRETYLIDELVYVIHSRKLAPLRLIHAQRIYDAWEFISIFGLVNVASLGSENRDSWLVQPEGQVIRNLTAHWNDYSMRILQFDDIHNSFISKLIEI